ANPALGLYYVILVGPEVPEGWLRRVAVVRDGALVAGRGVDAMGYASPVLGRLAVMFVLNAVVVPAIGCSRTGLWIDRDAEIPARRDGGNQPPPPIEAGCPRLTGDCNDEPSDGCESDLSTDDRSCGACGHACVAGRVCRVGQCLVPGTIAQVSAGAYFTCALTAEGAVYCWGDNRFGAVGDGTTENRDRPVRVHGVEDVAELTVGFRHACARSRSGAVDCWGWNREYELADGTMTDRPVPVRASGLPPVVHVAAGANTCGLERSGIVWCWGNNTNGGLGDGSFDIRTEPVRAYGVPMLVRLAMGAPACGLDALRRAWCWGENHSGQLGRGTDEPSTTAELVPGLPTVSAISPGGQSVLAVDDSGSLWGWGANAYCSLADGTADPRWRAVPSALVRGVTAVGVGLRHGCAIRDDRIVVCWGDDLEGQTGDGPGDTTASCGEPATVVGLTDVVELTVGSEHSCARTVLGTIWCWGDDAFGQIGAPLVSPRAVNATVPVQVVISDE
ncbi:MAG: hypothetical protein IT379_18050, partial [Deltaproteobacteria bacterium]|nr:hypothetical protein [Deltaproteobacteria bacterium]